MIPIKKLNITHLCYLSIAPEEQGKGLGKDLIKYVCEIYSNVSLECEERLSKYYQKNGFQINKKYYALHYNNKTTRFFIHTKKKCYGITNYLYVLFNHFYDKIIIIEKIYIFKNIKILEIIDSYT